MRRSAHSIRRLAKCILSMTLAVWFTVATTIALGVNSVQEIILDYTLPDGTVVRLDAPRSAFPNCNSEELFLTVEERPAESKTSRELSSALNVGSDSMSARIFDVRVMKLSANTSGDLTQSNTATSASNESSCANEELSQTISQNLPSSAILSKSTQVQPQGAVTLTFILPEPVDTSIGVKVYHMNEKDGTLEDMNVQIGNSGEVVMQARHFSVFAMVSLTAQSVSCLTAVTVTMDWIGGNVQTRPTSATVHLMAGNTEVQRESPIVLNSSVNWTHTWKNLPVKNELGQKIFYRVTQDPIRYSTPEIKHLNMGESVWIPANELISGETYLIADNVNYAMGFNSTNAYNLHSVLLTPINATLNATNISAISAPEKAIQWTASKYAGSAESFYLKNGGAYLCQYKDESGVFPTNLGTHISNTSQNETRFSYTDSKTLASNAATWVMRSGESYIFTQDSANATPLTLYQQFPADLKINITNNYQPPNLSDEGKVEYHKRIDFLGDKEENPDTALDGKDDYRLYLDVASGIKMPADLVLVLDASGSMDRNRMALLNDALIGQNGFIPRFLNAHSQNRLSIVYFWGASKPYTNCGYNWATNNPIVAEQIKSGLDVGDATIYQGWMTAADLNHLPTLLKEGSGGTNYGAGLYHAQCLLDNLPANPNPTQYMVFMSDGVPTHALSVKSQAQAPNTTSTDMVFGRQNENVPLSLHSANGIYRYGSGAEVIYNYFNNINFCKQASKMLAKNFTKSNPDLNIFSVGVEVKDPEVLQNLASGTGRYLNVNNVSDLDATFASVLGPRAVIITDSMSEYVDFAGSADAQALGLKITSKSGDVTKTLWSDGSITADGSGIILSVELEPATKKVTATFVPTFTLPPNTVYTLSFNVKVTQKAYEDYAAHGYLLNGEFDTDYGGNDTSSQHPGFYSNNNEKATLSYVFGTLGTPKTKLYQKPVVQVHASEMTLNIWKTDDSLQQVPLSGAEFQLFNAVYDETNKVWIKGDTMIANAVTNADGESSLVSNLPPGHYFLVEVKPPSGYQSAKSDVLIYLDGDRGIVKQGYAQAKLIRNGDALWQVHITNTRHLKPPAAGGIGTKHFIVSGTGFILLAAILLSAHLITSRRKKI